MCEKDQEVQSDPLIEDVRNVRRAVLAACDNDLRKLAETLREMERRDPARIVDRTRAARGADTGTR